MPQTQANQPRRDRIFQHIRRNKIAPGPNRNQVALGGSQAWVWVLAM